MRAGLILFILVASVVISARASTEFPITNYSFEQPILGDGTRIENVGFPGWIGQGSEYGVANPANVYFTGTTDGGPGASPIDGKNAAYANGGSKLTYQDSNFVVSASTVYQLNLLVGRRAGEALGFARVSFWAGTNLLAAEFPEPANDQFIPSTLTYTSPPSGQILGKPLRIEVETTPNGQVWFDDVHLFYEYAPLVCTPHRATAIAQLVNGVFVGATMVDAGCGYTNVPAVVIKGGGGFGATAVALIQDGRVTGIRVTNGGCCYTNTPIIEIASPPFIPKVHIEVSKVNVIQEVVLGWKYVLETSTNAVNWTPTGDPFVADSEWIVREFEVDSPSRQYRLKVVP